MPLSHLTLVDTNPAIVAAWRAEFRDFSRCTVEAKSIFETDANTLVSPANSFGVMDGGLDGKLRDFLGESVEMALRARIDREYFGELPVGLAIVLETGHHRFPYLLSAPTMRIPGNVAGTINAYLAMKAALNAAKAFPVELRVAVPGFCSLTGGMPPSQVARQMRIAYERFVLGHYQYSHWREERDFERFVRGELLAPPDDLERPRLPR